MTAIHWNILLVWLHEPNIQIPNKPLESNRFIFRRAKGSHHIYYNAELYKTAVVPVHGGKDLKEGTFLSILKQAGIEKNNN
ncbi:type II toxin-antitoxin system HicA family toxin [Dyadobacter psychrotolerans]|uniref:Type II toxin-antitoxin system HicA family toxin n=1 Tax=Dyadobacter psychrotolerans TaxID=2541721 RepID=A0A4R5E2K9_9BACT|nr:type II toxin-antitoxin system HicA family toxin [Dyadobacter psychrotolerans]TDE18635.1 type II toxin-antitoxin system HicA family toxin [Dyadobacter psychrotolerans]